MCDAEVDLTISDKGCSNNLTVKERKDCHGIALYRAAISIKKYDENALLKVGANGRHAYLWPPCDNCKYLLTRASAEMVNFNPAHEMPAYQPPKKTEKASDGAAFEVADEVGGESGLLDGGVEFDEDEEKNMFEEMSARVHHSETLVAIN